MKFYWIWVRNAETQHLSTRFERVIIIVVRAGAVKIYVAAVQAPRKMETQDETQFTTKIGGKLSLSPSYFLFKKKFIPSYAFDGLLCRNSLFSPPNCLILWITLINKREDFSTPEFCLRGWEALPSCKFIFLFKIDYIRRLFTFHIVLETRQGLVSFWFLVSLWLSQMGWALVRQAHEWARSQNWPIPVCSIA